MKRTFLTLGAVMGALVVFLGAFGAHALKNILRDNGRLDTYETAVKYHFYHAIVLIILALAFNQFESKKLVKWSGWSFFIGTIIFSGSLYILCFSGFTILGAVTPFGGLFLITGWVLLALAARGIKK